MEHKTKSKHRDLMTNSTTFAVASKFYLDAIAHNSENIFFSIQLFKGIRHLHLNPRGGNSRR